MGASLCWWANVFGTRDDLADLLFTTRIVTFNGRNLPGLLNIARCNAGACTSQPIQGQSMQVSPNIPPHRQMQGFWLDWFSSSPGSTSWNWNADANQRAMLLKARARGANGFELFSNSPLWWMCVNHNPSGSPSGSANNLQSWNTAQHATYLATIARYAADHWGIRFQSVEPSNEPSSDWWTATGRQEGCHIRSLPVSGGRRPRACLDDVHRDRPQVCPARYTHGHQPQRDHHPWRQHDPDPRNYRLAIP